MKLCIECRTVFVAEDWHCPACGFVPEMLGDWPTFRPDLVGAGPKEFDQSTYERMAAFEKSSFYCQSRLRLIQWALTKFFPTAGNFYDFGAGTGYVLDGIRSVRPDLRLYGSDLSNDSLTWVDTRLAGNLSLFHTDAEHIPYSEHFDVIGAFDVLEHIEDEQQVLRAFHTSIKPGGGILLTVPQHMMLWSRLDDETGHKRRYRGDELAAKVKAAGFDVVFDTCFMGTLFLPQYVSRRWLVSPAGGEGFEVEHTLPGSINGLLEGILSLELLLIKAGLRLPFGGMRIVAARKS
ncbi:MAG: class I SAM-dependent methyltransferase [Proteobacteria bacterium]|nr:class I SAM-dependent methyltransferase [Pseudomonadota bacterium]